VLLAPRLQLRAHRTRTRDQRDQPHALFEAQPQRPFAVCLAVSHNAAHPGESERHTLLNRYGCLWAITRVAVANAQAARETITTHTETQEHLLEIITPIFAVPRGRPRRARPFAWAGLLLIGPLQGERRRILREPGGRDGIDRQGVERDSPKHAVQIGGTQRIEELPQPVIMERCACEAGLE
jgi:hypothetical protein